MVINNLQGGGNVFTGTTTSTSPSNDLQLGISNGATNLFSGVISGARGVFLSAFGSGTQIFTGDNTYTGGTSLCSCTTLQLGNGGTTGSVLGDIANGGTLIFNRSNAYTFSGAISDYGLDAGQVIQAGTGTTILTGTNTYTGGTTISAGTLQLGNGGTTGSILGDVNNNASLAFNRSDAVTFGGVISGSGAVNQIGTGTTTLTAANSYTDLTTVTAGTLVLTSTASIAGGVLNNATFTSTGQVSGGLVNNATVNANGGAIDGGILNAGTFNVTGSVTSDSRFGNASGATPAIGNGGQFTLQGLLTNSGLINVTGNGLLIATAGGITNTARGAITVAAGGTVRDDLSNAGTVTNNGAYFGAIATNSGVTTNNASWTGNVAGNAGQISNTGIWSGDVVTNSGGVANQGVWTGRVGDNVNRITNTGVWRGDVVSNSGTISNDGGWTGNVTRNASQITNAGVWTGDLLANNGRLVNNAIWNGAVTNSGEFVNASGATLSGLLTSTAGAVTNNGALNGAAAITGGILTGTGSVTNLTIGSGAIFAPGNGASGSAMTVSGNLALQSGAIYLVQLDTSSASLARVTGSATLGGATVSANFASGSYVARRYNILNASGGVVGTFGSLINSNLPSGFRTSLRYDANAAYLDLTLEFTPGPNPPGPNSPEYGRGLNINRQNVANALTNFFNTTGGIPLVFGALTPAGLTQASGELATRSQQSTFDAMSLFLGLITDPFVSGRGEGGASGDVSRFADEANAYAARGRKRSGAEREAYGVMTKAPPRAHLFDPRWSIWAAGFGGSQTTEGNAVLGSNTATSQVLGMAVGADYLLSPRTVFGFAMAGGGTSFALANGLGNGRSDLFQAGAFVRHSSGQAYLTGALAYGWQDVTSDRSVTVAGLEQLHARFSANSYSGRIESGYRFVSPWMGWGLTPYAAGQFTTFNLPAYAEQVLAGAGNFALNYASRGVTASRTELGLRSDKSFAFSNAILTLRGRAAWAHNFETDRSVSATFPALPGASFVVNGATQPRNKALTTASAELKWTKGVSLAGTFEGEFADASRSFAGKGVARYEW